MTSSEHLGGVAARGAATVFTAQISRALVQTLGIMILARMLAPADYGLIAMAMVVISFADTFRDFGFSAAAVQAKVLTTAQRTNLFWTNTGIGLALTLAVWATAGIVAQVFNEPSLKGVMWALGPIFLINGAATQYRASLSRALRFGSVAWTEVFAQVVGLGSGVVAASAGWGYWALTAMQLVSATVILVVLVLVARWLPGLPRRGQDMGPLLRFGTFLVGSQLVTYASNNIDTMVLGRRFGPETVGVYDRPYRLLMLPLAQVRAPSTTVAIPVLSRLQEDDSRYSSFLLRGQLALGYVLVVPLGFVAGASVPVVAVFLGDQWGQSAPILALLAVSAGLRTLAFVGYWVYLSKGLTRALLWFSMFDAGLKIGLVVFCARWGVLGVAAAVAVTPAITWLLSFVWLSRLTTIPLQGLITGGLRIAVLAATMGIVAFVTVQLVNASVVSVVQLLCAVASCAGVLGFLFLSVPAVRRDLLSLKPAVTAVLVRR